MNWGAIVASFLASAVEFVEAFTIVLAVGIARGWRSSLIGAAGAIVALAAIIAALGSALMLIPLAVLQAVIGSYLLLFGLKWLRKAMLRSSGFKTLHNENEVFAKELAELSQEPRLRGRLDAVAVGTSFNGVLLEGLEVAFIVIGFGVTASALVQAAIGAMAAGLAVAAVGFALRAPLQQVPENLMKWIVGIMLTSFGTFWAGEGLGVTWWRGDLSLPIVIAIFIVASLAGVQVLKQVRGSKRYRVQPEGQPIVRSIQ
jgi:uncharacterized membrane protein